MSQSIVEIHLEYIYRRFTAPGFTEHCHSGRAEYFFELKADFKDRRNEQMYNHYAYRFSRQGGVMLDRADYDAVEAGERSIDEFINRQSKAKERANREEEAWKESTRRVNERRRRENRQSWIDYFEHMHRLHLGLAAEHTNRRSRLMLEADYESDEAPGGEAA